MKVSKVSKLHQWRLRAKSEDLPCARCGRVGMMTLDHIVPANFIDSLGLTTESYDDEWNFQYLCRACNTLKGSRMDFGNPKTFENIQKYVEKAKIYYFLQPTTPY